MLRLSYTENPRKLKKINIFKKIKKANAFRYHTKPVISQIFNFGKVREFYSHFISQVVHDMPFEVAEQKYVVSKSKSVQTFGRAGVELMR